MFRKTFYTISFIWWFFALLPLIFWYGWCNALCRLVGVTSLEIYYLSSLIAVDQFANTKLGGDPDETLSGRLGRAMLCKNTTWFVPPLAAFVDWLAYIIADEENHCLNSVESEELHARETWTLGWNK